MAAPSDTLAAQINAKLQRIALSVAIRQAAYLAARGRYWQGIRTHLVPPADGTLAATDPNVHPTDQTETWADLGIDLDPTLEVMLEVDAYVSTGGQGYVFRATIRMQGGLETWQRAQNFGPDGLRTHGWRRIA